MDTNTVSADLPATFNELKARQKREIEQLTSKHSAEALDLHSRHREESVAFTNKKAAEAALLFKAAPAPAKKLSGATTRINSSPKKPIQFTSTELMFKVPVATRDKFAKGRDVCIPEGTEVIDLVSDDDDDDILEATTGSAGGPVIGPGRTLSSVEFLSQIATGINGIPSTKNEPDSPSTGASCELLKAANTKDKGTPITTGRVDSKFSTPTPSTPPKARSPGKKVITPDKRTQIPHNQFRNFQFDRSSIVKSPTKYAHGLRSALEQPAQVAQMFKESPVGEKHFQQGPDVKQTVTQKIQDTKGFSASRTLKANPQKRQSQRVAPMTPPPALSLSGYPLTPPTSGSGASFTPGIKTSTSSVTSRARKNALVSPTQVSPTASKGNKRKTIDLSDSEVESSKLANSKLSPKSPRGKPTVQVRSALLPTPPQTPLLELHGSSPPKSFVSSSAALREKRQSHLKAREQIKIMADGKDSITERLRNMSVTPCPTTSASEDSEDAVHDENSWVKERQRGDRHVAKHARRRYLVESSSELSSESEAGREAYEVVDGVIVAKK